VAGVCSPGTPKKCDDGDPDTNDSCNATTGQCEFKDASPCTSVLECADTNPCTTDTCDPSPRGGSICHNRPIDGLPIAGCEDGDCDDNNACTSDTCDQSTTPPHCSNLAAHEGDSCVSDDVCTNSAAKCSGGTCIGEPLDCPPDPDDPDLCVVVFCDPAQGCVR